MHWIPLKPVSLPKVTFPMFSLDITFTSASADYCLAIRLFDSKLSLGLRLLAVILLTHGKLFQMAAIAEAAITIIIII